MCKKKRFSKFITTPCPLFPLQDNITDISGQQFHRSAHLLAKILIFFFYATLDTLPIFQLWDSYGVLIGPHNVKTNFVCVAHQPYCKVKSCCQAPS